MKQLLTLALCLAVVTAAAAAFAADNGTANRATTERWHYTSDVSGSVLTSTSSAQHLARRETAGPDTFALYGGPDELTEGKFQLDNGITPDWGGGNGLPWTGAPGEWTPVDLTDQPVYWHRSQFNAQTLGTNQPSPNHAMWSGVDAGNPIGESWVNVPGYGNNWADALLYESTPLGDTSAGQVVDLDFYFHLDTEPGFDLFQVQYDSAGTWTTVMTATGTDADSTGFQAPGVRFSDLQAVPIEYLGNDYGGDGGDQIRIRLIVISDTGWSDEDGLFQSVTGAAQVDEITMNNSLGSFSEDFETVPAPPAQYLFAPDKASFAGDFAEVYPRISDLDPCRDNETPVIGMLDTGQIVRNGPGIGGDTQVVGGSSSPGVNYGIAGNYVVNYTGGLSFGEVAVTNEIWSPDILWDLPGGLDDDVEVSGSFLRFTNWVDLPLTNGIFYLWHVRSALAGEPYNAWADRNFVYFSGGAPVWGNFRWDVTDLIQAGPERVQIALATWDFADIFQLPGNAATPSPAFDNVALYKYRVAGPAFATRNIDLAQDGFPVSGSVDVSTQATRDALDIPFSMAQDINSGTAFNVAGDSIIVDVSSVIPGATIADIRMVWALNTNAVFEDAIRSAPTRVKDENVVAGASGTVWTGEVVAEISTTANGTVVEDRYFVDLPDVDFMYPGDVLHYYLQATDSDGRVTTLPANTAGFLDFDPNTSYNRTYTVRGLPTIFDTAGTQPNILVWNDFGRRGGENEWVTAFRQLGYGEGVDYDTYTTQGPDSSVSNGLGSSGVHGANADQLSGYNHMFYFAGNLDATLLSNGAGSGNNDKGDDVDLMQQWHALPGPRNVAYFGDHIATGMSQDSAEALAYLGAPMGVDYGDVDVRDVIGGQTAPLVVPDSSGPYAANFAASYIAYGGCLAINQFDQIQPISGAASGHLFTDASGIPIPETGDSATGGVASVINPHGNGLNMTFPYSASFIYNQQARSVSLSARTVLFQEILGLFSADPGTSPIVSVPEVVTARLSVFPNPFNPQTTVKFTAALGSKGSVKVYNLRGELVRTLHDGEYLTQTFTWDGTDSRGASVASGVYVVRAIADGQVQTRKAALVK